MSYFSKFPYVATVSGGKPIVITDFLRRVSLSNDFQKNVVLLDDYFIQDGVTPEMVSYELYGEATYHWVILSINGIVDVRSEWPVKDVYVTDIVYQNYDFVVTVPSGAEYEVDDVITSDTDGLFVVTEVDGNTVNLRSQNGKTILTTSSVLENTTSDVAGLTVISIIDPEEGVHHYYDTELNLIVDIGFSGSTVPVTNYEYEVSVNDAKRTIKVLDERLLQYYINEFDRLIKL